MEIHEVHERLRTELRNLEESFQEHYEEYTIKVTKYDMEKKELHTKIEAVENIAREGIQLVKELSKELSTHQTEEALVIEKMFKSIYQAEVERRWVALIGASLIAACVWFYSTQYLPQYDKLYEAVISLKEYTRAHKA